MERLNELVARWAQFTKKKTNKKKMKRFKPYTQTATIKNVQNKIKMFTTKQRMGEKCIKQLCESFL